MAITIDFQPYARPPRLDALGGIALVRRLLSVGYTGTNPATMRALVKVRDSAVALQGELKKRGRTSRGNLRPLDAAFDTGWSALRDRLAAWSLVRDAAQDKDRARAEQLVAVYFPDGVEFVKLVLEQEWVFSQALLERFADEGAVADLERLAGAPFLANVRAQHEALGAALGLSGGTAEAPASTTGLAECVAALSAAIGDYTRRYAGEVDTDDANSVTAFRRAMAPLDAYRASSGPAGKDEAKDAAPVEPEPAPTEPLPPLPSPFINTP